MPPINHAHPDAEVDSSKFDEEDSDLEADIQEQETIWTIKYYKKPIGNSSKRTRELWNGGLKHESSFHGKGQSKDALSLRYNVEPATWVGMQYYGKCVSE